MDAKEKSEILISHFMGLKEFNLKFEKTGWASMNLLMAKECALISVDEIIYEHNLHLTQFGHERILFWQEVKQELEKL